MLNTKSGGILNILKPPGMTSFDVIAYLRKILNIRKIGHAGTLDPEAVGVLPVCIGRATKAIEYLIDKKKSYRAELTLGIETDTQDSTGKVIGRYNIDVTREQIEQKIKSFLGVYRQVPPMHSAVKVNGKKLYELAREGKTIERKVREVKIYSIDIVDIFDLADNKQSETKIIFDVICSKGTYVRTLCADIGKAFGCGAYMSFLVRTRAGMFDISSAVTLETLYKKYKSGDIDNLLIDVDKIFNGFKEVILNYNEMKKFKNGVWVDINNQDFEKDEVVKVYDNDGNFLALGEFVLKQNKLLLKTKKTF